MGVRFLNNYPVLRNALYFGILGGLIGILIDFDHSPFIKEHFSYLSATRPFHISLAILACSIFVYSYACLRRLRNR